MSNAHVISSSIKPTSTVFGQEFKLGLVLGLVDAMATSYDYLFKLLIVGGRESNKHKMLEKFLSQNNATAPVGNLTTGITYGSASGKRLLVQ